MIEINQAIFGEGRDHGHSLLKSSYSNDHFPTQVSGFTDLIDRPASGVLSLPIIRGFIVKEHFLLIKSFPDTTGRRGRVFSHALIVTLEDYAKIQDITDLMQFHMSEIDKDAKTDVIKYSNSPSPIVFSASKKIINATDAVLNHVDYNNNIVWVGDVDYWNWISAIWHNLPLSVKLNIKIGNAFSARNLNSSTLNLLIIPQELKSNWLRENCKIIDEHLPIIEETTLHQYLLGSGSEKTELTDIIFELEPKISELDDLRLLDKYAPIYRKINDAPPFRELLMLADLVSKFNSNPKSATTGKSKILEAFAKAISIISAEEFLLLQHQTWNGYDSESIKTTIGISTQKWLQNNLYVGVPSIAKSRIAVTSLDTQKRKLWHDFTKEYIAKSLTKWVSKYAPFVWAWFKADPKSVSELANLLPNDAENDLVNALPQTDKELGQKIINLSVQKKWFNLLGMSSIVHYSSKKAFELALSEGGHDLSTLILKKMATKVKDVDFIADAAALSDDRLIDIAADLITKNKALKSKIEISSDGWQKIWLQSISKGSKVWEGIKNPSAVLFKIMDHLLAGLAFDNTLLKELTSSIKNYQNRTAIWKILPEITKNSYLVATLIDILKDVNEGKTQLNSLEQPLLDTFESKMIIGHIISSSNLSTTTKLQLLPYCKKFSEDDAKELIENNSFTQEESQKFGKTISNNGWRKVANYLLNIRDQRDDLTLALKECSGLLGLWERLYLAASGHGSKLITPTEFWDVLLNKATSHYPDGPNQNGLWERSGGDRSDLHNNGSGKQIWNNALGHIKNGGSPSPKDLLNKMIEDYSFDDSLKQLKQII